MARTQTWRHLRRIDLRFALGIALVLISVGGVVMYVHLLNRTTPVYVATSTIPSGHEIQATDLRIEELNLAEAAGLYVTTADDLGQLIATRPILPGELIAKSAVSNTDLQDSVTTVVAVTGALPSSVDVGRTVDVWAASDGSSRLEHASPPANVVTGAEVIRIDHESGFAAGGTTNVELRIPKVKLSALLTARSNGLIFTIVAEGTIR